MNQVVAQTTAHDAQACRVAQAVQEVAGVEQVILFGSRARGDFRPDSDLDLLVVYGAGHARPDVFRSCVQVARKAATAEYARAISVDITPLAADHFDFMRNGVNHVAAQAARDGITPMGYRFRPPSEPREPSLPEHHRRESMERILHARRHLTTLTILSDTDPDLYARPEEWEVSVGENAQGALEHGLKAVIAACGHDYPFIHPLDELLAEARKYVPDLSLRSALQALSTFAGGEVYGTPDLDVGVDELLADVRADVTDLLAICARKANFDPWTVGKDDFQRGA